MLLPFIKGDNILNENPFIQYEVQFNLIHRIADGEGALLLRSEDNNIIIAMSNVKYPMWVWVNPDSGKAIVEEAIKEIEKILKEEESFEIIGTPEFLQTFFNNYKCEYKKLMEMESYICKEVIMPKETLGVMTLPSMEDIDIIAEFCVGFIYDGFGKEVTKESQLKGAERLINSRNLYVLKVNDEIVSMANLSHRAPRHGRINTVYTPPKHRKKGYASKLVANLSNLVLSEGLTPVLFTDLTNKTSNKVYKGIGYTQCGKVDQYRVINIKDK